MSKNLIKALVLSFAIVSGALFPLKTNNFFTFPDNASIDQIFLVQQNSLKAVIDPFSPQKEPVKKLSAILTAYSSSYDETWGDPFITASGQRVRTGVIANNCLPFGTMVEINGMYFEVLDRKNSRYGCEWFDIWKPSKQEAINFGITRSYINIILEN